MDLRERPRGAVQRHPWELARARFFLDVLLGAQEPGLFRSALDAGSGDAYFAQRLAAELPDIEKVVCYDTGYQANSRQQLGIDEPRVELCTELPAARFDLLLALDVLEHVDDDHGFLLGLVESHIEASGLVLLSVPAWSRLSSRHDRRMLHHRRYQPGQFRRLIDEAGLSIIRGGGLFHTLLVPRVLEVALDGLGLLPDTPDDQVLQWQHGPLLTGTVATGLRIDNILSKLASRIRLPLPGLSEWALCRAR
jgi:hypothetical protein